MLGARRGGAWDDGLWLINRGWSAWDDRPLQPTDKYCTPTVSGDDTVHPLSN
jgi:hypothetical protein